MLKWWIGYKGRDCAQCGFYEAAHYNHDLDYDIDSYPCDRFRFKRPTDKVSS